MYKNCFMWVTGFSCYKSLFLPPPRPEEFGLDPKQLIDTSEYEIKHLAHTVNHLRTSWGEVWNSIREETKSKAEIVHGILVVAWGWVWGRSHVLGGCVCRWVFQWPHRMSDTQGLSSCLPYVGQQEREVGN